MGLLSDGRREWALFLDIETTGLSAHYDEVTLIGALGGGKLALFVNGVNLDRFPAYVAPINFDVGCLGAWIVETLSSWDLA